MNISGLQYVADYVSPAEHNWLVAIVDQQIWMTDLKRRVQHYGYRYDYKSRSVDASMFLGNLPEWLGVLAERLHKDGFTPLMPDQVIINEYLPGQGIASHIDCEPCFGEVIISLTLGSTCVMNFTRVKDRKVMPILLQPRSLVVMQGEARYDWKHGILARKNDVYAGETIKRERRISLTFRNVVLQEADNVIRA